jgi:DnaK suppressor protein
MGEARTASRRVALAAELGRARLGSRRCGRSPFSVLRMRLANAPTFASHLHGRRIARVYQQRRIAMLTTSHRDELARLLREKREALFHVAAAAERDLEYVAADREAELEERAQEERAARLASRLDDRVKLEIEEIDAALQRLREGRYGRCARCDHPIPVARLHASPAALHCIACAQTTPAVAAAETEMAAPPARQLPGDLTLLSDRELEEALREQIRADGRIDLDELRIVCRHGVVHLAGALPSEREHQELLKLLTDVSGLIDVDDRVAVNELLWDRADRSREPETPPEALVEAAPRVAHRYEIVPPTTTENIAEHQEEDAEFVPPVSPIADEE